MPAGTAFTHEALLYAGREGFIEGTLPFIREGLDAGEAVLVAVPSGRIPALRAALDGDADRVMLADMERLGRNPARIISAWREFLAEHGGNGGVRGVGEPIWHGRGPDEIVECQRHEALLNLAFDGGPGWRLMCPYDTAALDPEVILEARRSHPLVWEDGACSASEEYVPPPAALHDRELSPPPGDARRMGFGRCDLKAVRRLVGAVAAEAGFEGDRIADLALAVTEAASNSVLHGGGAGTLTLWRAPGQVVCEVRDQGRIRDPLAGRARPAPDRPGGRGMWLINELCDLVQVRCLADGSVVRLELRAIGAPSPAGAPASR